MRDRLLARLALVLAASLSISSLAPLQAHADEAATSTDSADVFTLWQEDRSRIFAASEVDAASLAYRARILVVFAEAEAQPQFGDQLALIEARIAELSARDVIVVVDADPDGRSALRQQLRPRGFSLVLLDKDGTVVFRKPDPWDVREISRQIDKLPSRLQEVRG